MPVCIDARRYDGVLFDLDGVVTDTAAVHAKAWRALFDDVLSRRPQRTGEDHSPFAATDYLHYIDGKPRADGIRDFLAARGITLPEGEPDDDGDATVCGLATRKQRLFEEFAVADGIHPFDSTIALVRRLHGAGIATAVYSASRNCRNVLRAAGIPDLFAIRVDGNDARALGLAGKPDPAVLLEAAHRLAVAPQRCVVVEDAESGVTAARRGGFGMVIGVDRTGSAAVLDDLGADQVVADLSEVRVLTADR
jgi:alpha,alpha-trehalase